MRSAQTDLIRFSALCTLPATSNRKHRGRDGILTGVLDLNRILLRRAKEVGVTIGRRRAIKPILRYSKVSGVATADQDIFSNLLIDASGELAMACKNESRNT